MPQGNTESRHGSVNCRLHEEKTKLKKPDLKATALLKLTYLEMFGHDMSWASFNVLEVMSSPKYVQKRVGYLGAVQSFRPDTEVLMLAENLLKKVIRLQLRVGSFLLLIIGPHLLNFGHHLSAADCYTPRRKSVDGEFSITGFDSTSHTLEPCHTEENCRDALQISTGISRDSTSGVAQNQRKASGRRGGSQRDSRHSERGLRIGLAASSGLPRPRAEAVWSVGASWEQLDGDQDHKARA